MERTTIFAVERGFMTTDSENSMTVARKSAERKKMKIRVPGSTEAHELNVTLGLTKSLGLILAVALGWLVWHLPPPDSLDQNGMYFLATLTMAVMLWVLEIFEEYIVGLMLLIAWVVLDIVPSKIALAGFSESSWFFVVGALGIGAAVNKTGLLHRLAIQLLGRIPLDYYKTHTFLLLAAGMLATPFLPTGKARTVIAVPVSQAISAATGFKNRSNGSAAMALSALIGFSQLSFMFLTGAESCLIGWNLLPSHARSEFGWMTWFIAALPAGIVTALFVFASIQLLFPLTESDKAAIYSKTLMPQLEKLGALTNAEWISLSTLGLTLMGWLTMPLHGINEAWIAVSGLLVFLLTGILDKNNFKNNLDWGLILFFGIVNGIAAVSIQLKVDRWFIDILGPVFNSFSFGPLAFLMAVILLVCVARLFLRKSSVVTLFSLTTVPLGQNAGIHPGVLLLTILMASECYFLPYQEGSYQIAYSNTNGLAFSHAQARKVMIAKFLSCFLVIVVSVSYWKLLGFIL
jgi:DASS family divalent anion:Na+ symporter